MTPVTQHHLPTRVHCLDSVYSAEAGRTNIPQLSPEHASRIVCVRAYLRSCYFVQHPEASDMDCSSLDMVWCLDSCLSDTAFSSFLFGFLSEPTPIYTSTYLLGSAAFSRIILFLSQAEQQCSNDNFSLACFSDCMGMSVSDLVHPYPSKMFT